MKKYEKVNFCGKEFKVINFYGTDEVKIIKLEEPDTDIDSFILKVGTVATYVDGFQMFELAELIKKEYYNIFDNTTDH